MSPGSDSLLPLSTAQRQGSWTRPNLGGHGEQPVPPSAPPSRTAGPPRALLTIYSHKVSLEKKQPSLVIS